MKHIDINCDLGESFGAYILGNDADILPLISSASIACGFHAGDPLVMDRTVRAASDLGLTIGAHPGYPDLAGFGRRNMDMTPSELESAMVYQIGALQAFCVRYHTRLSYVKPHGALYNTCAVNPEYARTICRALASLNPAPALMGLSGSVMIKAARETGLKTISEVFADRAYRPDGTLVSRREPGSVIHDPDAVADRALAFAESGNVRASDGSLLHLEADSICIHGDTPQALENARKIHDRLTAAGFRIQSPLQEAVS